MILWVAKLKDLKGYIRLTQNKLLRIRDDLVSLDEQFQQWDFPKLVEAMRMRIDSNPKVVDDSSDKAEKLEILYQTKDSSKACVYIFCEISGHRASDIIQSTQSDTLEKETIV